jgi:hypothetical protein
MGDCEGGQYQSKAWRREEARVVSRVSSCEISQYQGEE